MKYKVEIITKNGVIAINADNETLENYELIKQTNINFMKSKKKNLTWTTGKGYVLINRKDVIAINTIIEEVQNERV